MSHYAYSVAPHSGISPSTYSRVYGYGNYSSSSLFDGTTMHVLFGTYNSAQNQFNFQPTNFVSIDVLWPAASFYNGSYGAAYVDVQAFAANNTLMGTYRYNKDPGSFTRISLSLSGIARIAIIPPSNWQYDIFGLDWLNFHDLGSATVFNLSDYQNIKAPNGMVLANTDSLTGTGTITGNLSNIGGRVSPGHSGGVITINGNFTQNADGLTILEVGAENDHIIVSGTANLAGTLEISISENSDFKDGDIFTLMTYASYSGRFNEVLGLEFDGGFFDLDYGDTALTLTVNAVPLPAALWLLGSGLASLGVLRRRPFLPR
jgi:hypothetical protein